MLHRRDYINLVRLALEEDIGTGDVTSNACLSNDEQVTAYLKAKENLIFCGGQVAVDVFHEVDPRIQVELCAPDGEWALKDDIVLTASGCATSLLTAERTALNFLQRMSGVSTLTASYVAAVAGTTTRVLDTRKTIPGWRRLDKYAVHAGGGHNHRWGLYDGVLIKDNHIAAVGSITGAIERAQSSAHHLLRIEVEVSTMADAIEAVQAGADHLLLDNMTPVDVAAIVSELQGRVGLEVSGGITLESLHAYAQTGVDFVSVGALTHSAPAVDISMTIVG